MRGNATCVLCGGSSPVAMLHALRRCTLPWRQVTLIPSDERLVAVDHDDSNEAMIRNELLQDEAAAAKLLSLGGAGIPDRARLAGINAALGKLPRPLDLVVLGMGDDGHTASLFPTSPNLADALESHDECVLQRPEHLDVARLTLTPALLLDAREIVLLFFGEHKRTVYEQAINAGDVEELPVRCVLQQRKVPVTVFWAR